MDVIDLCSDVDQHPRPVKSSPVRTKLEGNVTVILTSDDETPQPSSKTMPRRPTRLKKPTLKARALLEASRDDVGETQTPLRAAVQGRVNNKCKRPRPSTAASPLSNTATDPPKPPSVDTKEQHDSPISFAGREDTADDEEAELQRAIDDSTIQEHPAIHDDDDAPQPELTGDGGGDKQAGVAQDRGITQDSLSFPPRGRSNTKTLPPSESPTTPAPTLPPALSTCQNLPLAELHAESPCSPVHDESELESHPVSNTTHTETENEEPALQDPILLSLIWAEGGTENAVVNSTAFTGDSREEPGASDLIVTAPSSATDHESRVENTTPSAISRDTTPVRQTTPSFRAGSEHEDKEMQHALFASLSQEQGDNSDLTEAFERRSQDNGGHDNENTEVTAMQPIPYPQIVDSDDTNSYLPPHLSYALPPLPDIYEYSDQEGGYCGAMSGFVQDVASGEEDGPEGEAEREISALGVDTPVVKDPESRRKELNAETIPSERQFGHEEENEDMLMQKTLFQSLSSNEGPSEPAEGNKDGGGQDPTEEYGDDSHPIPTNTDPDLYFPSLVSTPSPPEPTPVEHFVSEASKTSTTETLQLEQSTRHSTPDRSSNSRGRPLNSSSNYTLPSDAAGKPNLSITYSSCPLVTLPRLLTPRFFTQSFLPPICQTPKASPTVVKTPATTQSESQSSGVTRRSSSPPPIKRYTSPQYDEVDDGPEMKESSETNPPPDPLASATAQPPSGISQGSPSEEAEEEEVDLELTHADTPENDAILAADFTDVQGHATGSPGGDSTSPGHGHPNAEQLTLEDESWLPSSRDSSNIQQNDVESGEGGRERSQHPSSEQPKHLGKSVSESSVDSSATIEDSPAPTTPVQLGYLDPNAFFIRSSSPVDFNRDILKDFMDISVPSPLDKDDDAYLLSTHSFDYP